MLRIILSIFCLFSLVIACGDKGSDSDRDNDGVRRIGDYTIEHCDNGVDDNDDGLIDCADSYCQLQEVCVVIPPDPSTQAPPGNPTELTNFNDSIRFLYEGDDKITSIDVSQSGQVAAGSLVDDADGERTLKIYFEPDTLAQVTLPNIANPNTLVWGPFKRNARKSVPRWTPW